MSIKRHLSALFHRERCDRNTLIPMLEKLNEQERMALCDFSKIKSKKLTERKVTSNEVGENNLKDLSDLNTSDR